MITIHDLPAELLCEIFQMVQGRGAQPRPSTSLSCYRARFRSLIVLSLVCKSWRELTLECGALWSSVPVDTSRVDCLESGSTMVKRSNGAELELSVHIGTDLSTPDRARRLVKALMANNAQIGSLYLSANPRRATGHGARLPETADIVVAAINLTLTMPHSSSLLRGLRTLSLSLPSPAVIVNISTFLETIKTSKELAYLHLASFHSIREDCPSTYAVCIPKLCRLSLRACDAATILSHIITPKTSTIDIVMDSPKVRKHHRGSHILTALPQSLTNICALEGTAKLILEEDESRGGLRLGLLPLHSKTSSLLVTNGHHSLERFILRSLGAIAANPYFGAIQSFTFSCFSCAPIPWPTVLNRFDLLSELNTSSCHAMDVAHTLLGTRVDGSPPCSSLRRIRFCPGPNGREPHVDPQIFATLHKFRLEHHCSAIKITLRRADRGSEEL